MDKNKKELIDEITDLLIQALSYTPANQLKDIYIAKAINLLGLIK